MKKHFHLRLIQSLGPLLISMLGAVGKLGSMMDFGEKANYKLVRIGVELQIPPSPLRISTPRWGFR